MSEKELHKHWFVPVGVEWRKHCSYSTDGEVKWNFVYQGPDFNVPRHVILACECGAVKRKEAFIVE